MRGIEIYRPSILQTYKSNAWGERVEAS